MGARSTLEHDVHVYDHEPGLISIDSEPAATAVDTNSSAAIRRALDEAGYGETEAEA
jgi:hypothetical protein